MINLIVLYFNGLKIIKKSKFGLILKIIDKDWKISETVYYKAIFTINQLGYLTFLKKNNGKIKKFFCILAHILKYIAGALSLLKLIEEVNLITIYGDLESSLEGYVLFVDNLSKFLFKWINFNIDLDFINILIVIEENEYHIIVVLSVFVSTFVKGSIKRIIIKNKENKMLDEWEYKMLNNIFFKIFNIISLSIFAYLFCYILIILIIALLPFIVNIVFWSVLVIFYLFGFYYDPEVNEKIYFNEMKNTLFLLIFLIVLNYSIFKNFGFLFSY